MVESIINDSLMRQIEEISRKRGISFAEACQILVENGVSFTNDLNMHISGNQHKTH